MIGKQFTSLFFSSFLFLICIYQSAMPILILTYFYVQHNIQLWKEKWGLESSGMLRYMRLDGLDSATGTQKKAKKEKAKECFFFVLVNPFTIYISPVCSLSYQQWNWMRSRQTIGDLLYHSDTEKSLLEETRYAFLQLSPWDQNV